MLDTESLLTDETEISEDSAEEALLSEEEMDALDSLLTEEMAEETLLSADDTDVLDSDSLLTEETAITEEALLSAEDTGVLELASLLAEEICPTEELAGILITEEIDTLDTAWLLTEET